MIEQKISQLEAEILKLKFHIEMLNTFETYENNPIAALVISLNWSEDNLEKAHDIFEKYEKQLESKGQIDELHHSIEEDFKETFGLGYQKVKQIVLAFFRNSQWVGVCVAFVKSFNGTEPIEFREIVSYIKENNL